MTKANVPPPATTSGPEVLPPATTSAPSNQVIAAATAATPARDVNTSGHPLGVQSLLNQGMPFEVEEVIPVTRNVLKQVDNVWCGLFVTSLVYKGEQLQGSKMQPADLINIIDMTSGEEMVFIANTVFMNEVTKHYKDGSYLGRVFAVCSEMKKPIDENGNVIANGRGYRTYKIQEMRVKGQAELCAKYGLKMPEFK